jgi:hypothetical protein
MSRPLFPRLCTLPCRHLPLLLGNIKYLKERKVIQPLQINTFQYDLGNNKVNIFFLQLNLGEKLS